MSSPLMAYALNVTAANLMDETNPKELDRRLDAHIELLRDCANFDAPEEEIERAMNNFKAAVLRRIAFLRLVIHPTAGRA